MSNTVSISLADLQIKRKQLEARIEADKKELEHLDWLLNNFNTFTSKSQPEMFEYGSSANMNQIQQIEELLRTSGRPLRADEIAQKFQDLHKKEIKLASLRAYLSKAVQRKTTKIDRVKNVEGLYFYNPQK